MEVYSIDPRIFRKIIHDSINVSDALKQTGRVMAKDENICLHCGLCAERCPTHAFDMRRFVLQLPYAGTTQPLLLVRK